MLRTHKHKPTQTHVHTHSCWSYFLNFFFEFFKMVAVWRGGGGRAIIHNFVLNLSKSAAAGEGGPTTIGHHFVVFNTSKLPLSWGSNR